MTNPNGSFDRPQDPAPGQGEGTYGGGSWDAPPTGPVTPGAEPADPWADERAPEPAQSGTSTTGFPFPSKTWTTSNGSRITVGGCCLPLPLLTLAAGAAVLGAAVRRR